MPTGYTVDIYEGKEISFEKFVWQCVRAFGISIMQRDEPGDVLPLKEHKVDPYHKECLDEALRDLELFLAKSDRQLEQEQEDMFEEKMEHYLKRKKEITQLRNRYQLMIQKVEEWKPSTKNEGALEFMNNLKNFMLDQLNKSMDHDCYEVDKPKYILLKDYKTERLKSLKWKVDYHKEQYEKEIARVKERNDFTQALMDNIPYPE